MHLFQDVIENKLIKEQNHEKFSTNKKLFDIFSPAETTIDV